MAGVSIRTGDTSTEMAGISIRTGDTSAEMVGISKDFSFSGNLVLSMFYTSSKSNQIGYLKLSAYLHAILKACYA